MYLFGLEDAKTIQRERMRRAQLRRVIKGPNVIDSFVRHRAEEADIVEVEFGRSCDRDLIGA